MTYYHAHGFVDGAYLSARSRELGIGFPNPYLISWQAVNSHQVQSWARPLHESRNRVLLTRVTYYDAAPDAAEEAPPGTRAYWDAIEAIPDTALGFGYLRGRKGREPRQKAVDTLVAVDMLVGAFTELFSLAVLVAGDADFVPVVDEVRRRGVHVVLVTSGASSSRELQQAADRVLFFGSGEQELRLEALQLPSVP